MTPYRCLFREAPAACGREDGICLPSSSSLLAEDQALIIDVVAGLARPSAGEKPHWKPVLVQGLAEAEAPGASSPPPQEDPQVVVKRERTATHR